MDKIIVNFLENEIKRQSNCAKNIIDYGCETEHMRDLLRETLKERSQYKRSLKKYIKESGKQEAKLVMESFGWICPNCGKQFISDSMEYCTNCGQHLAFY